MQTATYPFVKIDRKNRNLSCHVYIKEPGQKAKYSRIWNELQSFQIIVKGNIETVTISDDMIVICNGCGRLDGMQYNCRICGVDFYGTIIIIGSTSDDFKSITKSAANRLFKHLLKE